ncbi:hypothetical protein BJ508DRAFT_419981 [Ascobolus immersus RN42]|uniref:Uncharacterized protein n=1 Tax=Ascobolus immersus RN42 TaxID=1160509 RepID=A0A3N4HDD8_ASCIM|nr:hypothetical protein BJ508DRAFT_419981 [Ascobolus immersus RN42]
MALATKFTYWYPYFRKTISDISTNDCAETLALFLADSDRADTPTCYAHVDCLLDNLRESTKEHMGASTVVLGLTPLILSTFAPNIGEIALISARRPLMAFLLAAASVTLASPRLVNPITQGAIGESLSVSHSRPTRPENWCWYDKPNWRRILALAQYPFLLASIANAVHNSYELGNQTVLAWKCNVSIFPLIWTLIPGFIFLLIAIPFRFSAMAKAIRRSSHKAWLQREFKAGEPIGQDVLNEALELAPWTSTLMRLGVMCGILHGLVGAVIFSSVMFLSVLDAFVIVVRYGVSAMVCYGVFTYELYCMQPENRSGSEEGLEMVRQVPDRKVDGPGAV